MKQRYAVFCGVIGCMAVLPVCAQQPVGLTADSIKMDASVGWLAGKSQENVYDTDGGGKISQLDWKIKNTPIINMGLSWDANRWLTLNAQGWTTLASRSAKMDDYDWLDESQSQWSDWSTHPNTRLNHANEFDLNLKGWLINQPNYRLGAVLGYQQTRYSWTALGGYYQYDNGSDIGAFPRGERVGGYKQKFSLPYIGIAGLYRYQDVEFTALLKFSPWVQGRDNDEHYLRALTFRDNANAIRYYSAGVNVGYYLTPRAKVFTGVSWSQYAEGKGGTQVIDNETGESEYDHGDVSGIANRNYSLTVGVQYQM